MKNFLLKFSLYFLFVASFFYAFMFFVQRYLLYFPSNRESPESLVKVFDGRCLTDSQHPAKGAMLVFHGNGGQASDGIGWIGLNPEYQVILAEYPGYGHRSGKPSEAAIIGDAVDIANKVKATYPGDFIVVGQSLGSGVAAGVASQVQVDKLLMLTPFDSVKNVAKVHYGLLGLDNLVLDTYDSMAYLRNFNGKMAIIMGGRDEVVPNANTENLIANLKITPKVWKIDAVGHNGPWPSTVINEAKEYLEQ